VEDVLRDAGASEAASGPHEEEDEEMTHEADFEPSVEEPDATKASKGNGRSRESQVGSSSGFLPTFEPAWGF
jgi:hypothetical protein